MGKIGIFANCQHGDIALCTCILKYKDILWPGKDIVWYISLAPEKATYLDMLKHNDAINEIRDYPPFTSMEHFRSCIDPDGKFVMSHKNDFESTKDLDAGFFPAPWSVLPSKKYEATPYANIPKTICGVDPGLAWHPYLGFSDEEREKAKDFCAKLPHSKTIMLETELRSAGMFRLDSQVIRNIMQMCRNKLGKCNFIFASKIDHTPFVDDPGVVSCSDFTVRQTALIHNYCDLFVGVCSGITMAVSCWGNKPVPRVELCGAIIQSNIIANGTVNSMLCDNMSLPQMNKNFESMVFNTLNQLF